MPRPFLSAGMAGRTRHEAAPTQERPCGVQDATGCPRRDRRRQPNTLTHTLVVLLSIGMAVVFSFLVAGVTFAVARWGGARCLSLCPVFAMALMVIGAVLAVVLAVFK